MAVESASLKVFGASLGFDEIGVCDPGPHPFDAAYRSWIERGFHGGMEYLARHADIKASAKNWLPSANSVVAVTLNYNQPNPCEPSKPHLARYALGRDYHKVLRSRLRRLAGWIVEQHPESEWRIAVDSAPVADRAYAYLAGLGWFGKNTMLIDSHRGSWFVIGLLLTSVEFERDVPSTGGCGTCRACIDACPTGCIVFQDGRWLVDARRCISYQTIEHKGALETDLAGWSFGCDVCQEVCPFNTPRATQPLRAAQTSITDFLDRRSWPSLDDWDSLSEAEWDALSAGSPVRRAGLAGMRRNVNANKK